MFCGKEHTVLLAGRWIDRIVWDPRENLERSVRSVRSESKHVRGMIVLPSFLIRYHWTLSAATTNVARWFLFPVCLNLPFPHRPFSNTGRSCSSWLRSIICQIPSFDFLSPFSLLHHARLRIHRPHRSYPCRQRLGLGRRRFVLPFISQR
jgi:hypothetical protein